MSAKNDIQLKGTNLNNVECQDKDKVLHPETNAEQVLTTQNSDKSLEDWLTYNKVDPTTPLGGFSSYNGMVPWLEANYPNDSYTLPAATTSTLGGVIVGDNLTVSNGRVSVDRNSLSIPTIAEASYGANIIEDDYTTNGYGTIRIGNDTVISSDFGNSPITYDSSYKFPLRLDSKGRAGIEIDAKMFPAQTQADWNQTDDTKPDYIKGRPTLSTVATSGSYNDLTNKPTIGTVYNGVLTLKYGNTTLGTFGANTDDNTTVTIPTGLNYLPVETLPTENISTTTIYMLPKTDPVTGDYYDEWMYINSGTVEESSYSWEKIGNTQAVTYIAGSNVQINNNVISATDTTYTAGNGIDITSNVISQTIAADNTIGGIKTGYTKNDNKKPVQLDANNRAYVDTEQHPTVGGMITSGLSAHFFRVGTGMDSGSFTAGKWIPLLTSDTMTTSNIGKCSVCFEIFMREDSKTGYAKYYLNHMSGDSLVTNKILCLSFYSEDSNIFDYDDIRCAKYVDSEDNEKVKLTIYKKVRNVAHSMFIVNILSENSDSYSNQHYFYTNRTSSIGETGYQLLSNDLRIGTYNTDTQKMTACLTNESGDTPIEMNTIGADNATSYTAT